MKPPPEAMLRDREELQDGRFAAELRRGLEPIHVRFLPQS